MATAKIVGMDEGRRRRLSWRMDSVARVIGTAGEMTAKERREFEAISRRFKELATAALSASALLATAEQLMAEGEALATRVLSRTLGPKRTR